MIFATFSKAHSVMLLRLLATALSLFDQELKPGFMHQNKNASVLLCHKKDSFRGPLKVKEIFHRRWVWKFIEKRCFVEVFYKTFHSVKRIDIYAMKCCSDDSIDVHLSILEAKLMSLVFQAVTITAQPVSFR